MRGLRHAKPARKMGVSTLLRATAIASIVAFSTSSGVFLSPAFAQEFRFSTIEVSGNQRADASTILGIAGIGRGVGVSAAELNTAFQRLSESGLFQSVELIPSGNRLVIEVREFPIIGIVNFEGNRRIDNDTLAGIVQTRAGRVLSPAQVEADAQEIAALYRQRGRFAAEVTPRIIPRGNNRVDLAFEVREGNVVEIERLSFVGNRSYSDNRLRRVLDTKQAGLFRALVQRDTFVEERIALDRELLRDFYLSRGYVDFEVLSVTSEMARERDGFFLTFTIREGLQYRLGDVSVVSEVPGVDVAPYAAQLRARGGVVFSPTVIETNIQRLERVATLEGRRFVRVEPRFTRDEPNQVINVEFALVEGERTIIERIDIQGNTTTLDRVVRRQFRVAEGDPLNPREIREAAERIRALGYFSDVETDVLRGSSPEQAVVAVDVEETPTGSLGFGVSYGASVGVGGAINFSEANFLGRGQLVSLDFNTVSGQRELGLRFVEPALLERDLRYSLEVRYVESQEFFSNFDTTTGLMRHALSFPVSEFGRLEGRTTFRYERLRNVPRGGVDDEGEPLPVSSTRIQADEDFGSSFTGSIGYQYTLDTRRSGYDPTRGYVLQFSQDFGIGNGSRSFIVSELRAGYEQRVLNEEVTLRADLTAGVLHMMDGSSRVSERFMLDGRMRGFAFGTTGPRDFQGAAFDSDPLLNQDVLGGTRYLVAQFETEFPLGLPEEYGITGGAFLDVGSVWGVDASAGLDLQGSDRLQIRAAAGVSVFWDTPIGPLRFNFSRPIKKQPWDKAQNFDLTIVSRF